jgi:hypothetical protein
MTFPKPSNSDSVFMKRTVEAAIRIGVIAGLIAWCFMIARPFFIPISRRIHVAPPFECNIAGYPEGIKIRAAIPCPFLFSIY